MRSSRRYAVALWLLLCLAPPSWSALPATVVWEVRGTVLNGSPGPGADTNGGGFVAGATGTDYSQQNAAQFSGTDLAVDAVTNTKVTSATHNFVGTDVGDLINVSAGVGYTTGIYQIVSVAANAATLDRSPAAVGVTGGTWAEGGALGGSAVNSGLAKLAANMVASNKAFVTGAFTSNATISWGQNASGISSSLSTTIIGYGTTRGDATHATLTLQANTGLIGFNLITNGWLIDQVDVDCGSLGTSTGFVLSGAAVTVRRCKAANFTLRGFNVSGGNQVVLFNSEATGGTSAATAGISLSSSALTRGCFVHDNACVGILGGAITVSINYNIISNNTGASSDGIQIQFGAAAILNNTIHGNGRHGINCNSATISGNNWKNNIITNNAGFGIVGNTSPVPADFGFDGNAFFSNTSGARSNMDLITGIGSDSPYANSLDVTLTASPYVGPTTGSTANFALNSTAGGGAACKAAGSPGTWPGNTGTTGFLDFGAVQSKGTVNPPAIIGASLSDGCSLLLALLLPFAAWKHRKGRRLADRGGVAL